MTSRRGVERSEDADTVDVDSTSGSSKSKKSKSKKSSKSADLEDADGSAAGADRGDDSSKSKASKSSKGKGSSSKKDASKDEQSKSRTMSTHFCIFQDGEGLAKRWMNEHHKKRWDIWMEILLKCVMADGAWPHDVKASLFTGSDALHTTGAIQPLALQNQSSNGSSQLVTAQSWSDMLWQQHGRNHPGLQWDLPDDPSAFGAETRAALLRRLDLMLQATPKDSLVMLLDCKDPSMSYEEFKKVGHGFEPKCKCLYILLSGSDLGGKDDASNVFLKAVLGCFAARLGSKRMVKVSLCEDSETGDEFTAAQVASLLSAEFQSGALQQAIAGAEISAGLTKGKKGVTFDKVGADVLQFSSEAQASIQEEISTAGDAQRERSKRSSKDDSKQRSKVGKSTSKEERDTESSAQSPDDSSAAQGDDYTLGGACSGEGGFRDCDPDTSSNGVIRNNITVCGRGTNDFGTDQDSTDNWYTRMTTARLVDVLDSPQVNERDGPQGLENSKTRGTCDSDDDVPERRGRGTREEMMLLGAAGNGLQRVDDIRRGRRRVEDLTSRARPKNREEGGQDSAATTAAATVNTAGAKGRNLESFAPQAVVALFVIVALLGLVFRS
eukprot:CAMPEP_0197626768 /NCGR_PEP_ID=MMETSP1338-20131121/5581_1 /TAXON_ID=43686 ORGANISM="Pelagodinium beii, Strain RCC1491" /NCGR_SAMPLE_ID=MMETSP1338 /ASSEMBLY_ACC=CAM_ASM_000754 /LENGTH=609 /DNA_ID=CAMNT_0043197325 /DNA_START=54 /DNA_END=1883 /DNA_ORIENTATION=+